jgi:hypothetical protein
MLTDVFVATIPGLRLDDIVATDETIYLTMTTLDFPYSKRRD